MTARKAKAACVWLIERKYSFGWWPLFGSGYQTRAEARRGMLGPAELYTFYKFRIRRYIRQDP